MSANTDATLFLGNLDERVNERILFEIMVQAGPLVEVYMPRDKETSRHKGYGFAKFTSENSAQYALNLFSGLLCLFGRPLRIAISGQDKYVQAQAKPDKEHMDHIITKPLETSDPLQQNSPFVSASSTYPYNSAYQSYYGSRLPGQGSYLSSPVMAQSFNAQLASLGEWGLRSSIPNRVPHRFYPLY